MPGVHEQAIEFRFPSGPFFRARLRNNSLRSAGNAIGPAVILNLAAALFQRPQIGVGGIDDGGGPRHFRRSASKSYIPKFHVGPGAEKQISHIAFEKLAWWCGNALPAASTLAWRVSPKPLLQRLPGKDHLPFEFLTPINFFRASICAPVKQAGPSASAAHLGRSRAGSKAQRRDHRWQSLPKPSSCRIS